MKNEHAKALGSLGGSKNTEAQQKARIKNARRLNQRKKKYKKEQEDKS